MPVDVLIPAAIDGVITEANVSKVKAKIIAEGANGPITTDALKELEERGVFIIPDVLCNAGGVIVSYFEWVQGLQSFFWSEEEVNDKLAEVMATAFKKVVDIQARYQLRHEDRGADRRRGSPEPRDAAARPVSVKRGLKSSLGFEGREFQTNF